MRKFISFVVRWTVRLVVIAAVILAGLAALTSAIASPNDPEDMPGTIQGNQDPREAAYKQARTYCINNVSGPIAVEHGAGAFGFAGAFSGAIAGAVNGATTPMRETGTRPVYERCMTEKGFGKEVVERRPAHIKALHAQATVAKEVAATLELEEGEKVVDGWYQEVKKDPITDALSVRFIRTPSERTGGGRKGGMTIACKNGEARIVFNFDDYLEPRHSRATVRIDTQAPAVNVLQKDKSNTARGLWGNSRVATAFSKLKDAKKFAIRVPVYREADATQVYDLHGFKERAQIVATACGFAF